MNTLAMMGRKKDVYVSCMICFQNIHSKMNLSKGKHLKLQTQIMQNLMLAAFPPLLCLFYTSAATAESRIQAEGIHLQDEGLHWAQRSLVGRGRPVSHA